MRNISPLKKNSSWSPCNDILGKSTEVLLQGGQSHLVLHCDPHSPNALGTIRSRWRLPLAPGPSWSQDALSHRQCGYVSGHLSPVPHGHLKRTCTQKAYYQSCSDQFGSGPTVGPPLEHADVPLADTPEHGDKRRRRSDGCGLHSSRVPRGSLGAPRRSVGGGRRWCEAQGGGLEEACVT